MWISQAAYLKTIEERITIVAERDAARQLVAAQKNMLEWLMFRTTQLEAERAKLLWNYTGVKIDVPEAVKDTTEPSPLASPINSVLSFGDMGDEEAAKHGFAWDAEGNATLNGQRY